MSDHVEWIVDLDVLLEDAQALGAKTSAWLLSQGVVTKPACPQSSPRGGKLLLPGPEAVQWSKPGDSGFPAMHGLEVVIGRRVYHTGGNGLDGLRCPCCGRSFGAGEIPWNDPVQAWFDLAVSDALRCPACGASSSIAVWRFLEFEWGFGNLAFGFWNWPITGDLVRKVSELTGNNCRLVYERI